MRMAMECFVQRIERKTFVDEVIGHPLNVPNIIQPPCNHIMACANIVILLVACTNRATLIKSTTTDRYENLQLIPLPM